MLVGWVALRDGSTSQAKGTWVKAQELEGVVQPALRWEDVWGGGGLI